MHYRKKWLKGLAGLVILQFLLLSSLKAQPDTIKPLSPRLLLADVIPGTDSVQLCWERSPSQDVELYVVYYGASVGWRPADTSFSALDSAYRVKLSDVRFRAVSFRLVAVDSSGNNSPLSNIHTTCYLSAEFDSCTVTAGLVWTSYPAWPDDSVHYTVMKSYGSNRIPSPSLQGNAGTWSDTVSRNRRVCFYVEARHTGGLTARSNMACLYSHVLPQPSWMNADYASVTSEGKVLLSFHISSDGDSVNYLLYRSPAGGGAETELRQFSWPAGGQLQAEDTPPGTDRPWKYVLASVNACRSVQVSSNPATTVALTVSGKQGGAFLSWNPPYGYRAGTGEYAIYRVSSEGSYIRVGTVYPPDTTYVESRDVLAGQGIKGNVCYVIRAEEASGNPYGVRGVSWSNTACAGFSSDYRMPNAFTPDGDGINDEFGPVFDILPGKFHLIISDAGGRKVFETSDPSVRWNGRDPGGSIRAGTYLWYMRYTDETGRTKEEYGSLVLILKK